MKTKLPLFLIIITALLTSCATTQNTHTDVMNMEVKNQTKYGVMSKYGAPTQRRIVGSTEEWIYDLSQKTKKSGRLSANVVSSGNQGGGASGSSLAGRYSSYLKITFRNGRVIRWETKGVDYSAKAGGGSSAGPILALLLLASLAASLFISITSMPTGY